MADNKVEPKKKKKIKWWHGLLALLIIAGLIGGYLYTHPNVREQVANALNLDPNQGAKKDSSTTTKKKGIQIPGYPEITMAANDTTMRVALTNPKDNPCYFTFTFKLKSSGEVLYKSQDVAPGKTINEETLKRGLEAGTYPAVIEIRTKALKAPHAEMNGANVETQLVVK
ncbi:MAG: hypothetical protein LBT80_05130 [Lactobacillaceae bacterium]|jgi:hypothetical protein|nr:hypothetical protein [Lactobacillaceae bacterium]